jgi:hypothetical protein
VSNYADGTFDTRYGQIRMSNPGPKGDPPYGNVNTYVRDVGNVVLQGPALRAFRDAEKAATPRRMRSKGKVLPIRLTGVGYRSYAYQNQLFQSVQGTEDEGRYADPDGSMHVEALAVDIDMNQSVLRRARIKRQLQKHGWHYAIDGEPWHASFHLAG